MLIASCTSYPARIKNLPTVIDTILNNTVSPDKVIINLSIDEFPNKVLPEEVHHFVDANKKVSINWVEGNWKPYKKFLPILKDYPNDLIFPFDDDVLYPDAIIADALEIHKKHPTYPISCNRFWCGGLNAHCGAGSLVQAKHFKGWEKYVNEEMIAKCPADDLFYTQLAAMNGYFYKSTDKHYPDLWVSLDDTIGYSMSIPNINKVTQKALYELMGQQVKVRFTDDGSRPVCVLNILAVPRGLAIEEEFLKWAYPTYNVIIVEHDGKKFEYCGLNVLRNYILNNEIKVPALYLQSKGAWHVRKDSNSVRKMWGHEFTINKDAYIKAVGCKEPAVAAPYCGIIKSNDLGTGCEEYIMPYYNGWMANPAAIRVINCEESTNRYVYEARIFKGIKYTGIKKHDLHWDDMEGRMKMQEEVLKFR